MSIWKTWKDLTAKGVMGINRRNADYVLKYNKRHLYPVVDDKIITKERALEAGIHVPEMYGIMRPRKASTSSTRSSASTTISSSSRRRAPAATASW